ncbi:hypothetical protein BCH308197_C0019 (plasmid) [Bacillus cereus H3081.97]|nr:hypothetical protein BCH308197_C0019 [Bacillus cereus H3081.97]
MVFPAFRVEAGNGVRGDSPRGLSGLARIMSYASPISNPAFRFIGLA